MRKMNALSRRARCGGFATLAALVTVLFVASFLAVSYVEFTHGVKSVRDAEVELERKAATFKVGAAKKKPAPAIKEAPAKNDAPASKTAPEKEEGQP